MSVRVRRCPWCGGVYSPCDLDEVDADGNPNEPCACGDFDAEPEMIEASAKSMPHCPKCGYTAADAAFHGDHHLCDGKIPTNDVREALGE